MVFVCDMSYSVISCWLWAPTLVSTETGWPHEVLALSVTVLRDCNPFRIKILPSVALCSKIKHFLVSRSGLLVFSTQHWDLWGLRAAFRFIYLSSMTPLSVPSPKIVLFPHPISVPPERGARLAPPNIYLTQLPSPPQHLFAVGSSGTKRMSFFFFWSFYCLLLFGLPSKLWFLKCENPAVGILRSSFSISRNGELSRLSMASP